MPFENKNNMIKEKCNSEMDKFSNSEKLKKRRGRGLARVRRVTFRKGYMSLRMCEKQNFIMCMMVLFGMDWAQAVRTCRIGLSAVQQKRGYAKMVEDLFRKFKITEIWDE